MFAQRPRCCWGRLRATDGEEEEARASSYSRQFQGLHALAWMLLRKQISQFFMRQ